MRQWLVLTSGLAQMTFLFGDMLKRPSLAHASPKRCLLFMIVAGFQLAPSSKSSVSQPSPVEVEHFQDSSVTNTSLPFESVTEAVLSPYPQPTSVHVAAMTLVVEGMTKVDTLFHLLRFGSCNIFPSTKSLIESSQLIFNVQSFSVIMFCELVQGLMHSP